MLRGRSCTKAAFLLSVFSICAISITSAQVNKDSLKLYPGGEFYPVAEYNYTGKARTPKNVILMIGDGMGPAQVYAALVANGGNLNIKNIRNVGFATTYCANRFVTDSPSAGTALSTGSKTNYGLLGLGPDSSKLTNIIEKLMKEGMATGVVSSSSVTHATPAAFVGHQVNRGMQEEIAVDFLNSGIDVFIGGGLKYFTQRKDGKNLLNDLRNDGYNIVTSTDDLEGVERGKLAALLAPDATPRTPQRGDMLQKASKTAINILGKDPDGFFLMIEGSEIDWGGHDNDIHYIIQETLDFDRTIGVVLEFASRNKETLVVITADHETGGLTIEDGNFETGMVKGDFTTGGHTGIMVPVFAFGPGAEKLTGIMDNTDIPNRILKLLGK